MKRHWLASGALLVTACLLNGASSAVTLAGKPTTITVAVPSAAAANNLVLHIEGMQMNPQEGAIVRVFAELPGADRATSVDEEHFVGHITLLARAGARSKAGSNIVLNVPRSVEKWLQKKRSARITLVPMSEGEVHIANVRLAPSTQ